jgi:MoaA/NifB/PqqE/SkfB family radical SAM enzyme
MCGQWSQEGYIQNHKELLNRRINLPTWKKLIDELAENKVYVVHLRGGEPFMHPDILELLEYIYDKGLITVLDTNGTCMEKYLEDIVRFGRRMLLSISVDGPEEIHDFVRGVKGAFQKLKENIYS